MEKIHFEQAKIWYAAAQYIAEKDAVNEKYAVAIAMIVHTIMKANDALTTRFLNKTAKKHDEARTLFEELIKNRKIDPKYAEYKDIIQEAIIKKAKAEYKGQTFSKNEFEQTKRKAEKFLKMTAEILKLDL